jgi:hypothetical protein
VAVLEAGVALGAARRVTATAAQSARGKALMPPAIDAYHSIEYP